MSYISGMIDSKALTYLNYFGIQCLE